MAAGKGVAFVVDGGSFALSLLGGASVPSVSAVRFSLSISMKWKIFGMSHK